MILLIILLCGCKKSPSTQYNAIYIDKSFIMDEYFELDSSRYATEINMHCGKNERMIFKEDDYEVMLSRAYRDSVDWSSGYEYTLIGVKIDDSSNIMRSYYLSWRNSNSPILPVGNYSWPIDESTIFIESNDSSKLVYARNRNVNGSLLYVKVDTIIVSWDKTKLRNPIDSIVVLKGYKRPVEKRPVWYWY